MRSLKRLAFFLFRCIVTIYYVVCFLAQVLVVPFTKLYHAVKAGTESTAWGRKLDDADEKLRVFNGFIPFCFFVICTVFSVVMLLMQLGVEDGVSEYFSILLFNTPIGSFLGFFTDGLDFSPEAVLSIAFSGTLFSACMGDEKPEGFFVGLLRIVRHIVFFVAFAHLSILLSGFFRIVGGWIFDAVNSLYTSQTDSFFPQLLRVFLLILLGYPTIEMILLAVKEYTECIALGIVFLLFCIVLALLMQYVVNLDPAIENDILGWILLISFFAVDIFRPYIDDIADLTIGEFSYISPYTIKTVIDRLNGI